MTLLSGYILVLDPERREFRDAHALEADLQYPVFVASSTEQAVNQVKQAPPCLVILVGDNYQDWSQPLIDQLRQSSRTKDMTILALTDSTSPQWQYREDNSGVDGLLVKPLSQDILRSLMASAFARQACI
ncbi:MAG: hypothetical protein EA342_03060 [Leptolyngbya sp. LCM1.Bin17]|nr:MAG: hypothetical protein EA342_03060 [Leptolyngbya sp. LCM1.Bin17]